ncbi:MAG TPA: DUF948 domain-containing protein [Bacteroidota bacterium]|nr:DUF948 domain-containing protein [Bacteroidota bacterium]
MESFLLIAQILVLLSLSALAIYLVVVLSKVKDMINTVELNIKEVSARALPVLENMEALTAKLRTITDSIDDQMSLIRNSLQTLRDVTENISRFERKVQDHIEGPIMEVASVVGGFITGVAGFLQKVTRRGR